jgi:amphi-Trp domain-containing protein
MVLAGIEEDCVMDLLEVTEKERVSRQEAAKRLRALATALGRTNEVEYERGDLRFSLHVPDEVDFKIEIELQDDEWELEVELKWGGKGRKR